MYICNRCGVLKSEEDFKVEKSFLAYAGDEAVYDEGWDMECDCGGEYFEAERCPRCGEYVSETHGSGKGRMCIDCLKPYFTVKNIEEWADGEDITPEEDIESFADWMSDKII